MAVFKLVTITKDNQIYECISMISSHCCSRFKNEETVFISTLFTLEDKLILTNKKTRKKGNAVYEGRLENSWIWEEKIWVGRFILYFKHIKNFC